MKSRGRRTLQVLGLLVLGSSLLSLGSKETNAGPSHLISMWGVPFANDDYVWVLDRSCSMGWGGLINGLKAEVTAGISQLQPTQNFSVIAFSDNFAVYSNALLPATQANRDAAINWVNQLTPTGSTCMSAPMIQALNIIGSSTSSEPALLVVADGAPNCPNGAVTLADVAAANTMNVPIHTFFVGSDPGAASFLETLATQNGGVYVDTNNVVVPEFLRGDANDDGAINLTDAVFLLEHLFVQGPIPLCPDAADVNDSDSLNLPDVVYLLTFLFGSGPPPVSPTPGLCATWVPGTLGPCAQVVSCP